MGVGVAVPWKRADWLSLVSIIVALIAAGITAAPYVYNYFAATDGVILSPADRFVTHAGEISASGTVENAPSAESGDQDLWLVVRPRVASTWYPVERLLIQEGGTWEVSAQDLKLGPAGNYQICLFLADSSASADFHQHVLANLTNADPPGMIKPPVGARMIDSVEIQRQD